jgi:hypothetical protein
MVKKSMVGVRVVAIALTMLFGAVAVTSVSAQTATQTPAQGATSPAASVQATTDTKKDDGFNDWGLLGLLGLGGLAGLLKRPTHEVRTVERPVATRVEGTRVDNTGFDR